MNSNDLIVEKPRWPQQQRFNFIRKMLSEQGVLSRSMLREEFGISLQQATSDISKLARLEPNLLWYDKSAKYFRPKGVDSAQQSPSHVWKPNSDVLRGYAKDIERYGKPMDSDLAPYLRKLASYLEEDQ